MTPEVIIKTLAEVADVSEGAAKANIAAAVVYKGDIISIGVNQMKTHPFQYKFRRNNLSIYLHAETHAIQRSLRELSTWELEKSELYVVRTKQQSSVNKNRIFGLARPCDGCWRCIEQFNLKRVHYTLDKSGYETIERKKHE
jgi:deoxycytidylate deaminase